MAPSTRRNPTADPEVSMETAPITRQRSRSIRTRSDPISESEIEPAPEIDTGEAVQDGTTSPGISIRGRARRVGLEPTAEDPSETDEGEDKAFDSLEQALRKQRYQEKMLQETIESKKRTRLLEEELKRELALSSRLGVDSYPKSNGIKGIKITNLTTKFTRQERESWINSLNITFEGDPSTYQMDDAKINKAVQHLDTYCRDKWISHRTRRQHDSITNTWGHFLEWTQSLIHNTQNFERDTRVEYNKLRQKFEESPQDFHDRLESYERYLAPVSEEERAARFWSKLDQRLTTRVESNTHPAPTTREQWVDAAEKHWRFMNEERQYLKHEYDRRNNNNHSNRFRDRNQPKRSSNQSNQKDNNSFHPSKRQRIDHEVDSNPSRGGRPFSGPRKRSSNIECYNCGQKGHIRPECPKAQQTSKIQQVKNDSIANRQGKGKESG